MHVTFANMARHGCDRRLARTTLFAVAMAMAGGGVAAGGFPADPECLAVTQSSEATYTIENTTCPDKMVLASIELANGRDLARCFVKKIRTQISIASEGAAPVINYQCIEGAPGCSVEVVRDMFPECHAG